tara:strand:- start:9471 stop:9914 length:444 start_codon:yes stop_codon:yes gene_type:complete
MADEASSGAPHTGNCACGAVRFSAEGEPVWAAYCHCTDCRRATGAPVTLWVGFPAADVSWTGTAAQRTTGTGCVRRWCGDCGSPLSYADATIPGEEIYFAIGAFEAPERIAPRAHAFWASRLPFVAVGDDLPRHDRYSRARRDGAGA